MLEIEPSEWLLSSYIAAGMENVPIFVAADNSEDELKRYLQKQTLIMIPLASFMGR